MRNDQRPNLEKWNFQTLMLMQALIGSISSNFRMVAMLWEDSAWVLKFYIEDGIDEDIEEIDEIICQYDIYQDGEVDFTWQIIVGAEPLPNLSEIGRIVYRRREKILEEFYGSN